MPILSKWEEGKAWISILLHATCRREKTKIKNPLLYMHAFSLDILGGLFLIFFSKGAYFPGIKLVHKEIFLPS